jgi:SAM-dependent methyltransferase
VNRNPCKSIETKKAVQPISAIMELYMSNQQALAAFHVEPSTIYHDDGYCFISPMRGGMDGFDDFILLEDENPIGRENNVHSQIRQFGSGLFSPWKDALFFSSSDGSDPRRNGRRYTLVVREKRSLAEIISNFSFPPYDAPSQNSAVKAMVDKGKDTNGSILYDCVNFAHFWRPIQEFGDGIPRSTLQIGPGGSLGFEVFLALAGVKEAYTIDSFPLLTFDLDNFMETLESLFSITRCFEGVNGYTSLPLALPAYRTVAAGEYLVGDSAIRHIFPRSFEDTGFPEASIDYLFSNATMEHVRDPRHCIREAARVLRPGGLTAHGIDLRDHRNFDLPLEFLKESDGTWAGTMKEYCSGAPHGFMNRWRTGDLRREFESVGLEVLECTPLLKADAEYLERELPGFDPRFRSLPREELAITSVFIVARKN